ncbi:NYN domain-containing protein [Candidatus Pacearchaeota archaeon]|nr:NYN domain-containing protein [Candidatus Pacearchaeota archaeon]
MNNKEKLMVFIDGSNLYHILKEMYGQSKTLINFNFEKFIELIADKGKNIRTYYYTAPLDRKKDEKTYSKQQKFFQKIKNIQNFKLVLCRMQKETIGGKTIYVVKEDDIHLAVDLVKLAYNDGYDTAILVSSDGDFVPAIKAVQEKGKKVRNIGFKNKFSWHLRQECDSFRQLNKEDLDKCFN